MAQQPGPRRRFLRWQFVLAILAGLTLIGMPLGERAQVAIGGGPVTYCINWSRTAPTPTNHGPVSPPGVGCFGGRPDYDSMWLWGGVGATVLGFGLIGLITRTVQIRRGTATE